MGCIRTKDTKDQKETFINQAAINLPTVDLPIDKDRENELLKMREVQQFLNNFKDPKQKSVNFGFRQFLETGQEEDEVVLLGCKRLQEFRELDSLNIALGESIVTSQAMSTIAKVIPRFKNLTTLEFSLNRARSVLDAGITALSAAMREFKNLHTLKIDISETYVTDSGLCALSESLRELKSLRLLELNIKPDFDMKRPQNVFVSDVGGSPLFSAIGELRSLENLNIIFRENHLSDKGAISLSLSLKELKNLKKLSLILTETKVGDEGAFAISGSLKDLKELLDFNFFLPTDPDVSMNAKDEIRTQLGHIKRIYVS